MFPTQQPLGSGGLRGPSTVHVSCAQGTRLLWPLGSLHQLFSTSYCRRRASQHGDAVHTSPPCRTGGPDPRDQVPSSPRAPPLVFTNFVADALSPQGSKLHGDPMGVLFLWWCPQSFAQDLTYRNCSKPLRDHRTFARLLLSRACGLDRPLPLRARCPLQRACPTHGPRAARGPGQP